MFRLHAVRTGEVVADTARRTTCVTATNLFVFRRVSLGQVSFKFNIVCDLYLPVIRVCSNPSVQHDLTS